MPDHVPYRDNQFFRLIPPGKVAAARIELPVVEWSAGSLIFEEGALEDRAYLVESGSVRISKAGAHGQETLGFVGPGSFFGEIALYHSSPRTARATAATDVRAAVLRGDAFARLQAAAPLEIATTMERAAVERLGRMNAHLVQQMEGSDAFREIGVGLSVIAHDMRSPLATIRGAAELMLEVLQREPVDLAQLRRLVDMILRTSNRGLEGADELLGVLRGERSQTRMPVELADVVTDVTTQTAGLFARPGVDFTCSADTAGMLYCERADLVNALINLLRNAVEALPPEGGRVAFEARVVDGSVRFVVADTGCGIPPELQGQIFERQFTHGKRGGTGLGLDQVRRVVDRHHGRIGLRSQPGRGSTFTVDIPLQPPDAARDLPLVNGEIETGEAS